MSVRIIPAQMENIITDGTSAVASPQKTRVAAYCRVSTDLEEQESSFEAQVTHYTNFILNNPSWEFAGIYADEGISGTGTKKRERFNAMIRACEEGQIDLVITKSISRFARNTLDCLQYIRELKGLGIPILFEKEHINTMDASGEMLITIMASLAQQESQSISQNVRMGQQYRMQQGKPSVTTWFMGYRMSKDKSRLVIVPEQAVVVRRIFREFLEGRDPNEIRKGLERDGIKSPSGKDKWYAGTVKSMLQNEKYMGDLLLQKWYIKDFISKQAVKNNGRFPKYYVQNAHEPVVPREVFLQVKGEFLRREHERVVTGKRNINTTDIPLFGKLVCCECGNTYSRFNGGKPEKTNWRCKTRIMKGTPCIGRIVKDKEVKAAVVKAFQEVGKFRSELEDERNGCDDGSIREIMDKLAALDEKEDAIRDKVSQYAENGILDNANTEDEVTSELERMKSELDEVGKQKDELLRQKAGYDFRLCQIDCLIRLIDEMNGVFPEKEMMASEDTLPETDRERYGSYWPEIERQMKKYPAGCKDLSDFYKRTTVHKHHGPVKEFNNDDAQMYIEKIVIHSDHMEVVFKAGVTVDVEG